MRVELIPNIPCPHCERQNTTHRLVRKEDGFTKVSRRCTSCGNEWTHTWDRDWLADAKIKRLRAENERLRARVERLREERDTLLRDARGLLRWLSRYDPITYKDLLAIFDTEKLWRRLDD